VGREGTSAYERRADAQAEGSPRSEHIPLREENGRLAQRLVPATFKQLCKRVDEENPLAFRLPSEIQTYFAGVSEDARGNYVGGEEARLKFE
jgi:hypothetical protein